MHCVLLQSRACAPIEIIAVNEKANLVKTLTQHSWFGVQVLPFRIGSGAGIPKEEGGRPKAIEPTPSALNFATPIFTSQMNLSLRMSKSPCSTGSICLTKAAHAVRARIQPKRPMMRLAICTGSRLPRPWIGQAFTAAPSSAGRYSSSTSADEFVKQHVGTDNSPRTTDHDSRKPSSFLAIRKIAGPPYHKGSREKRALTSLVHASPIKIKRIKNPLVRKDGVNSPKPWKLPAQRWTEKPLAVFSRRRALNLRRLPLATTIKDIILSIDDAVREHKVAGRSALTADIVIKPRSDGSNEVDAVVDFLHPDGAQLFRDLAVHRKFKVQGVVPEVSLDDPRDPSQVPHLQPSGEDEGIAQLSKTDRAEYFTSPELRKIARRTPLIYN